MFVYIIVNDVNLKIYVGKTTDPQGLQHYLVTKLWKAFNRPQDRSKLYAAIRKYGRSHFHIFPLYEGTSDDDICAQEKILIKALKARHPDIGYNLREGEGKGRVPWNKGCTPPVKKLCPVCEHVFSVPYKKRSRVCCSKPCAGKLLAPRYSSEYLGRPGHPASPNQLAALARRNAGNTYTLGRKHKPESIALMSAKKKDWWASRKLVPA